MIRVGPAGWSYADWEGVVYPQPRPHGFQPLAFLSHFVDCVEINNSFYGLPRSDHARSWHRMLSDRAEFRFVAKLHRSFTHEPLDASFARNRDRFVEGIRPLGERLSALLVQFPLSFRDAPDSRIRLERIREAFGQFELVLEMRHRCWYEKQPRGWLERTGFSLAAIDLPPVRDHPHLDHPTFGRIGYLRLHGRNTRAWLNSRASRDQRYDYLYGRVEIEKLTERSKRIAAGADETYVVTNNHFSGKSVVNAIDILNVLSGERQLAPSSLVKHFPHLVGIAKVLGQGSLF